MTHPRTPKTSIHALWCAIVVLVASACVMVSEPRAQQADSSQVDSLRVQQASDAWPSRDALDVLQKWLFGKRIEPKLEGGQVSGLRWSLLPTISYNPVFGFAVGVSATGAGRFGLGPKTRPSSISISGNYSTKGQTQALARAETTSPSGNYLTKLDFRFLDTQRSTWGLGSIQENQEEYPMEYVLYRAYATLYRRTTGSTYVGLGYHLDHFTDIVDKRAQQGESTPFTEYSGTDVTSTRASGLSLNLLADTRDNIVNPMSGYYISGSFRNYIADLGSDRNWQEFWVAVQMYPRLPANSRNILAFWLYSWLTFGPGPYYNLPATGWDTYGRGARGYLQGRIRAANQIYFESEYRFQITQDGLLGGVVFFNGTASAESSAQTFGPMDYAGGLGLRIRFNKYSRINLALDRAWGRYGSGGWFMGMSEVF